MEEYVVFSIESEVKDKKVYSHVKGEANARQSVIIIDENAHDELLLAMEHFFTEGVSKSMRSEE